MLIMIFIVLKVFLKCMLKIIFKAQVIFKEMIGFQNSFQDCVIATRYWQLISIGIMHQCGFLFPDSALQATSLWVILLMRDQHLQLYSIIFTANHQRLFKFSTNKQQLQSSINMSQKFMTKATIKALPQHAKSLNYFC